METAIPKHDDQDGPHRHTRIYADISMSPRPPSWHHRKTLAPQVASRGSMPAWREDGTPDTGHAPPSKTFWSLVSGQDERAAVPGKNGPREMPVLMSRVRLPRDEAASPDASRADAGTASGARPRGRDTKGPAPPRKLASPRAAQILQRSVAQMLTPLSLRRHGLSYVYVSFILLVLVVMMLADNQLLDDFTASCLPWRSAQTSPAPAEDSSPPPPPTPPPASSAQIPSRGHSFPFDPEDVVIMFKTGATKIWTRAPMHLSTTLSDHALTPNVVFYSDSVQPLGPYQTVDVLANVSDTIRAAPDFALWHGTRKISEEGRYLDSDDAASVYLPGGWRLDKYKFLPMVAHAARTYPDKKWFIYLEDDNYLFLRPFYAFLSAFDSSESFYFGGPATRLGEDFAHGGSAFALSQGALRASFLADPKLQDRWDEYSIEMGCGDHILSHALASKGVVRWRGFDDVLWPLQGAALWQMHFNAPNWCSPIWAIHKTHAKDLSALHQWDAEFRMKQSGSVSTSPRWGDLFKDFILPMLANSTQELREEWDNLSMDKHFASVKEPDAGQSLSEAERQGRPWFSREACRAACQEDQACLQWRYADDNCYLSDSVSKGLPIDSGIKMTSGWMRERIDELKKIECEPLSWERD
ncbi:hypothetical protein B2J93_7585 [Marssonina coronariae]|uniref:N-acetylgalactosaminide beta-1,3-galactosyltransferase n=1 Tax=Diplocarpon coronariae TaxID=2795749 RepID=A0A218Z692_9HELO|nr:hypothetical protein B2J93_7585 [Marssonina coronariae]